eukprot:CAMPEP_0197847726 /NCGR_PEP_ID=MMETSP1438-20131217/6917_1 /TAXON_ID=1461541 /ORGANISM="Pterosperma sp., Strain CCMP1384" /LENGTH=60 /DNA_ID=CAMNT_0043459731 /DNA_START=564 /DNA_END=746 /DNA_ORIENTATION=-
MLAVWDGAVPQQHADGEVLNVSHQKSSSTIGQTNSRFTFIRQLRLNSSSKLSSGNSLPGS